MDRGGVALVSTKKLRLLREGAGVNGIVLDCCHPHRHSLVLVPLLDPAIRQRTVITAAAARSAVLRLRLRAALLAILLWSPAAVLLLLAVPCAVSAATTTVASLTSTVPAVSPAAAAASATSLILDCALDFVQESHGMLGE